MAAHTICKRRTFVILNIPLGPWLQATRAPSTWTTGGARPFRDIVPRGEGGPRGTLGPEWVPGSKCMGPGLDVMFYAGRYIWELWCRFWSSGAGFGASGLDLERPGLDLGAPALKLEAPGLPFEAAGLYLEDPGVNWEAPGCICRLWGCIRRLHDLA